MAHIIVNCTYCNKPFLKEKRRFNESIKNGWRFFCSRVCDRIFRMKRHQLTCQNPTCDKSFERRPHEIYPSGNYFCSSHCASIVNGKRLLKNRICPICKTIYTGARGYCSWECVRKQIVVSNIVLGETILKEIQLFYQINKRIPFKKEFSHAKAARNRFRTWNAAIRAAGFKPNPVKFAHRHIGNDGHICDSFSEKIIDDWLFNRNVEHQIHIPYGRDRMTADFVVGNVIIEFVGLEGELEVYDRSLERKRAFWKEKRLNVIELFPQDLFPKSKLDSVLGNLLE